MEQHNAENWHLIVRYLKGEISESEKTGLFSWVNETPQNRAAFDQISKLWELTFNKTDGYEPDTEAGWEELKHKMKHEDVHVETRKPFRNSIFDTTGFLKIAAVLILLVGMSYLTTLYLSKQENQEYITLKGEEKQVVLPDSSGIFLKENSRLSLSKDFNKADRTVYFTGYALFNIKKAGGKKFTVYSGDAVTEVLGTTFYVRSQPSENRVTVTLLEGKVSFCSKKSLHKKVYLSAGESVYLTNGKKIIHVKKTEKKSAALKEGNMEFNDTRLKEVFQQLEDYYDVKIKVSDPGINNCRFTGAFLKCNVKKIITVLTVSLNLSCKSDENEYLISGQGCK